MEGSLASFANPSIQNGYYRFVQTTAPTQRSSGVPLVTGDRWHKPTDNGIPGTAGDWIWTGSDWVSADTRESDKLGTSTVSYELLAPLYFNTNVSVLGIASQILYNAPLGVDSSPTNYWTLQIRTSSSILTTLDGRDTALKPLSSRWSRSFTSVPFIYTYPALDKGHAIYKSLVAVGSPGSLLVSNWEVCLVYRYIHP